MSPAPPPIPPWLASWLAEAFAVDDSDPASDRPMAQDAADACMRTLDEAWRWAAETPDAPARLREFIRGIPEEFYRRDMSAAELAERIGVTEAEICASAERGILRGHLGPDGWSFSFADVFALDPDEEDRA